MGIRLYNNSRFDEAARQFASQLQSDASDSLSHYYLALCYQRLNQMNNAVAQYEWVLQNSSDNKMISYARSALSACRSKTASTSFRTSTENTAAGPNESAQRQANGSLALLQSSYSASDAQASAEAAAIMQRAQAEIANIDLETQAKIKSIQQKYDRRIEEIPKSFEVGTSDYRYPNPDYEQLVSPIRQKCSEKISSTRDEGTRKMKSILNDAQMRVNALTSASANIKTQLASPGKSMQLVPNGSNLYIQQYQNFGNGYDDNSDKQDIRPMRAKEYKLPTVKQQNNLLNTKDTNR